MTTYPLTSHPRELSDLLADTTFGRPAVPRDDTLSWVLFASAREQDPKPPGYVRRHGPRRNRLTPAARTRLLAAFMTAVFAAAVLTLGMVMVINAGVPLTMCLPWVCALVAGGMALTATIALLCEPPRRSHE